MSLAADRAPDERNDPMSFLNQDPHEYMAKRKAELRAQREHARETEAAKLRESDTTDEGGFDMSGPSDRLLAALGAHGVSCGTPDEGGWVDDNVDVIYKALVQAGWTPPADA